MSKILFQAVRECRFKQVMMSVDSGLDLSLARNEDGQNILVAALFIENENKREKMFRYLLRCGGNCLRVDNSGRSVLSWACKLARVKIIPLILTDVMGSMDFKQSDQNGFTALHYAVFSGCLDIVKQVVDVMLKYNISVDVTDNTGLTPYVHARRLAHVDIANVLEQRGKACRHLADTVVHKSVSDWEKIGATERKQNEKELLLKEISKVKICGRLPKIQQPINNRKKSTRSANKKLKIKPSLSLTDLMTCASESRCRSYRIPAPYSTYTQAVLGDRNSLNRQGSTLAAIFADKRNIRGKKMNLSSTLKQRKLSEVNNKRIYDKQVNTSASSPQINLQTANEESVKHSLTVPRKLSVLPEIGS